MESSTPHTHQSDPVRVAVITGSTRPNRRSLAFARWVLDNPAVPGIEVELIDLVDLDLPMLQEPVPAIFETYHYPQTQAWSQLIAGFDGYVLVTPEYNASTSAALKNALDHLYTEWNDKAVAFVGYGVIGGVRAVEHLRGITAELKMAGIAHSLHLRTSQVIDGTVRSTPAEDDARGQLLIELTRWARALRGLRRTEA